MKVTILGCGGSGGVPLAGIELGGHWGNCDPDNPNYYHAVLNTSRMKIAQCADAVEQLLK